MIKCHGWSSSVIYILSNLEISKTKEICNFSCTYYLVCSMFHVVYASVKWNIIGLWKLNKSLNSKHIFKIKFINLVHTMNLVQWPYPTNSTFLWLNLKICLDEITNKYNEKVFLCISQYYFPLFLCFYFPPLTLLFQPQPNKTKHSASITLEEVSGLRLKQMKE